MVSKRDFVVSDDHVKLSKHPQRGRVLAILKQEYPQYTFYWMTPKVLAWC
nr:MAG TPA: Proteasomal ubiquitin receptor [Caudoviricetes sp.]